MNINIFYFSGTGNTWWASEKLSEKFTGRGQTAACHSIELLNEEKTCVLMENSDIVVFAYPVYGSCMPEPMKRFIDRLPASHKRIKAAVIGTQMLASGDGAWFYHKEIERRGFDIKWTYHLILPNNISFRISPLSYTVDTGKLKKIFNKCEKKINDVAEAICMDKPSITGKGFPGILLGLIQRPSYKQMVRRPYKSPYAVDAEKCTKCMKCVQICPEGNITLSDGTITFGENCTLCMRCYNYCPVTAITAFKIKHREGKKPYRGPEGFDPALITERKDLMDDID